MGDKTLLELIKKKVDLSIKLEESILQLEILDRKLDAILKESLSID